MRQFDHYPNLTHLLDEKNISCKQLAKALGISRSALYRRRYGEVPWCISEVTKICNYLDCQNAIWLFSQSNNKSE